MNPWPFVAFAVGMIATLVAVRGSHLKGPLRWWVKALALVALFGVFMPASVYWDRSRIAGIAFIIAGALWFYVVDRMKLPDHPRR